jgi:hypothetical protein
MKHKSEIFKRQLINYSQSKDFDEALGEWEFLESTYNQNHCICSQPIFENCLMKNIYNGQHLIVGNVCVQKFFPKIYKDYNLKDFFTISKKIRSFKLKNLTDDFISKLEDKNLIDDTQRSILHRVLSLKRGWSLPLTEEEFRLFKEVILGINGKLNQNYKGELEQSLEAIRGEIKVLTEEERLESIRQVEERRKQREEWDRRDEELRKQADKPRLELLKKCNEILNFNLPANFDYSFINNMISLLQNNITLSEGQIRGINNTYIKWGRQTTNQIN